MHGLFHLPLQKAYLSGLVNITVYQLNSALERSVLRGLQLAAHVMHLLNELVYSSRFSRIAVFENFVEIISRMRCGRIHVRGIGTVRVNFR